jgi:hypothetical protein
MTRIVTGRADAHFDNPEIHDAIDAGFPLDLCAAFFDRRPVFGSSKALRWIVVANLVTGMTALLPHFPPGFSDPM